LVGSYEPWLAAIALEYGAKHLLVIEFVFLQSQHPQIETMYAPEFTEQWLKGNIEPFDFVMSVSCLEHDGLGRYGDILNPIGDLQSMARCLSYVKPGGFLFLGVPASKKDILWWNAHRLYGPLRLREFIAGWNLVAVFPRTLPTNERGEDAPLFVLQNPYGCTNGKSYQELYPRPIFLT